MGSREGVCWGESPLYPQTKRDTARICKWWWDGSKISHLHVKTHWDCIRWSTFLISITPKHLFTVIEKIPPTEPIAAVSPPADHETPQLKSTGILGWNVHRLKALFEDLKWKEQLHTDKQQPKASRKTSEQKHLHWCWIPNQLLRPRHTSRSEMNG